MSVQVVEAPLDPVELLAAAAHLPENPDRQGDDGDDHREVRDDEHEPRRADVRDDLLASYVAAAARRSLLLITTPGSRYCSGSPAASSSV